MILATPQRGQQYFDHMSFDSAIEPTAMRYPETHQLCNILEKKTENLRLFSSRFDKQTPTKLTNFFNFTEFQITCTANAMYHEKQMIDLFGFAIINCKFISATFYCSWSDFRVLLKKIKWTR